MAKFELQRPLVLALDLDSTFMEGEESDRSDLLDLLDHSREQLHLVYMSHGTAEELIGLAAQATLPVPDIFLADSGTTALKGDGSATVVLTFWSCTSLLAIQSGLARGSIRCSSCAARS